MKNWPFSIIPSTPAVAQKPPATFGSLLRQQRLLSGLSREALADRTGISEAIITKIEQSQAAVSRAQIHLLAQHLHLNETDLLAKAGYMRP